MGPEKRAAEITPALAVRANTAGDAVWLACWRDSEGKTVNRTVGKAHLHRRGRRPHPLHPEQSGKRRENERSERWRNEWTASPGRPPEGRLGHREAQVKAAELVRLRELEVEDSEQVLERRMRNAPMCFGVLMKRYLHEKETEHADGLLKKSTILDLRSSLRMGGRIGSAFYLLAPEEVDNERVEKWMNELRDEGLSTRTREKLRGTVGAVLTWGVERGWIAATPLVTRRRKKRKQNPAALAFYEFEQVELLARTLSERDGELFRVAAYTGLRLGELLALRCSDVDFSTKSIRVERSWTAGALDLPKSGKPRTVPMSDQAAEALARHATRTGNSTGLVFNGDRGEYLDSSALRRRWKKAQEKILQEDPAFPVLVIHALRHSFGTALARAGVPLLSIKEFMGHADLTTTMIYLHYAPLQDQAKLITEALGRGAAQELVEAGN